MNPFSCQWCAFVPRVLLFGAVSAAIRYNCFSRTISVSANKILRLPVLSYFDDFGALVPDMIKEIGLDPFLRFTSELGALAKDGKYEVDKILVSPCLSGGFPFTENGMVLRNPQPPPTPHTHTPPRDLIGAMGSFRDRSRE